MGNKYPLWAKARMDPSSMAQRLFSCWAEFFEVDQVDRVKLTDFLSILKDDPDRGYFHRIELSEEDEFPTSVVGGQVTVSEYPTVIGTSSSIEYTLVRVDSTSAFLYPLPDRLIQGTSVTVDNWKIFDSDTPDVIEDIENYERLVVEVVDSDTYYNQFERPYFGGHSKVILKGLDPNYIEFTEMLLIRDDGLYKTQNLFHELTEVYWDGFNGDVNIYAYGHDFTFLKDKFKTGVLPDVESALFLQLIDIDSESAVESFTQRYNSGRKYRRGTSVSIADEINFENITTQRLYDADSVKYDAVDLAVSPINGLLFVIDEQGVVHIYEHSPIEFLPQSLEETEETYMDILPLKSRVHLGESTILKTWFRFLRGPVSEVRIKRISPAGVTTYLQEDYTWATALYEWQGDAMGKLPENSWNDITFSCTFDELGQWNFYCEHDLVAVGGTAVSHTAVVCDYLVALKDIATEISSPDGIFFSDKGELCVVEGNTYTPFIVASDVYFADETNNEIIVRETYSEIEVQYE